MFSVSKKVQIVLRTVQELPFLYVLYLYFSLKITAQYTYIVLSAVLNVQKMMIRPLHNEIRCSQRLKGTVSPRPSPSPPTALRLRPPTEHLLPLPPSSSSPPMPLRRRYLSVRQRHPTDDRKKGNPVVERTEKHGMETLSEAKEKYVLSGPKSQLYSIKQH
jgi:hypothetical protein